MPTSASRASPGPFTTQPITATRIGTVNFSRSIAMFTFCVSSRTFTSARPHEGQATRSRPRFRSPNDRRMIVPALTSSTGSSVSDTRIVSPIPSARSVPIPTALFRPPMGIGPASVTPRCSG